MGDTDRHGCGCGPTGRALRRSPYAYASVAPLGRLIFTAGACPLDAQGRTVAPGDLEAQSEKAVANLLTARPAAGSDPAHILKTTVSSSQRSGPISSGPGGWRRTPSIRRSAFATSATQANWSRSKRSRSGPANLRLALGRRRTASKDSGGQ
ncbi:MAG TPA: Rid family hydrolase [Mycobacteriales bacterium]|nr:Rid family hydrolase [Mycobacteriales bacterium]